MDEVKLTFELPGAAELESVLQQARSRMLRALNPPPVIHHFHNGGVVAGDQFREMLLARKKRFTNEYREVYVAGATLADGEVPAGTPAEFYTVYSIADSDTPTRAESDHDNLDDAIAAAEDFAAEHDIPLKLRISI